VVTGVRAAAWLLIALLLAAAPASAEAETRFEGKRATSVLFEGGAVSVGDLHLGGGGLRVERGYKLCGCRLHLVGEYTAMYVGGGRELPARHGLFQRLGLTARYPAATLLSDDRSAEIAYWLEGGIGAQTFLLDEADDLARPDVMLGFAVEVRGGGPNDYEKRLGWGVFFGGRFELAQRGPVTEPVAWIAGAPAQPPASRGMPFDMGFHVVFGVRLR
jgi:hypothetical protein